MAYLTGERSLFPNKTDKIKELYDLPPSLKEHAVRYQELIGKESLNTAESEELANLSNKLSDYIITAEDRNYFGDVVIKLQHFFKENVKDYILNKQQEFVQSVEDNKNIFLEFIANKTNEIKEFANLKKKKYKLK